VQERGIVAGVTGELMVIVPHPDDEVFGAGGLLARMAEAGRPTATLHLTRGRAGRSLGLALPGDLGALREAELRASLATLGVGDVTVWDEHDFVPDAERGVDRHAGLAAQPPEELAERIAPEIGRVAPRAVVTFGPNGGNGHPDHVATHRAVTLALELLGAAHDVRLYAYTSDAPYAGAAREGFLDAAEIRRLHLPPTHVVEVDAWIETKLAAMACHRSQALSVLEFMRRYPRRLRVETFHRIRPVADHGIGPRTVAWL
jgi:N-acetylglucosamine malate deacetylase 2